MPKPKLVARSRALSALLMLAMVVVAIRTGRAANSDENADITIKTHIFQPSELPPPELTALKVPKGFVITRFAENLGNARMLAVAPDGTVYVTRREEGDVLMLKDDGHGHASGAPVRVASRSGVHGIALHKGLAYLATANDIFRAPVLPDGHLGPLEMLIHDLPDAGQHNTRTVQIGPDGMMYISVGSTCNECTETNPENATLLRGTLDGKTRSIFASGLRDTIGWAWHPRTGELWGMDQGIDWIGDEIPPEELNHIEKGKRYGWPYVWGDNQLNQRLAPPGGLVRREWLAKSTPIVLPYTSHASPMQMSFYDASQFPEEYRGDALVSMHGSWNRKPPSGYEVVRIRFKNGQAVSIEPFVTGFVSGKGKTGRPCGNAIAHDGALLFTDDLHGIIYRVAYNGGTAAHGAGAAGAPVNVAAASGAVPAGAMQKQAAKGSGVPIAIRREETSSTGRLTVTSSAFADGGTIPSVFSEYEQGASFPLTWTAGPAATQSYLLVMEDPDSQRPPNPVIHWVAWNIPATVTSLREGMQKQDRLEDPPGLRQGPNSSGSIGYRGPRPPAGDPAHHYHVQLFALDRKLDLVSGSDRDEALTASKGHVLARGELVGTFKRPDNPQKP